jgi:hypothetical protein
VLPQERTRTTPPPAHAETAVQRASRLLSLLLFSTKHLSSKKNANANRGNTMEKKAPGMSTWCFLLLVQIPGQRYTHHGQHGPLRLPQCIGPTCRLKHLFLPIKTAANNRNPSPNSNPGMHFMVSILSLSVFHSLDAILYHQTHTNSCIIPSRLAVKRRPKR